MCIPLCGKKVLISSVTIRQKMESTSLTSGITPIDWGHIKSSWTRRPSILQNCHQKMNKIFYGDCLYIMDGNIIQVRKSLFHHNDPLSVNWLGSSTCTFSIMFLKIDFFLSLSYDFSSICIISCLISSKYLWNTSYLPSSKHWRVHTGTKQLR